MRGISIFGCGWVGKALANKLKPNYQVNCSVKSSSSYHALEGLNRFLLHYPELYDEKFYLVDVFVIAIPPRGTYLESLEKILSFIPKTTQIILLSSTSVYPQTKGIVREEMSQEVTAPSLMLQAEDLVQSLREDVVILRLGGLMGYERVAGRYTAGQTKAYDRLVNYVHRDDVINLIECCIEKKLRAEVFNVVAPNHPKESELYAKNANTFGWEATYYKSHEVRGKVVSSLKLIEKLNYNFLKPNPMDFW